MCRKVECARCEKLTYAGCGMHVEQVLAEVPQQERCRCREEAAQATSGNARRDGVKSAVVGPSLFRRILGG